jgi:hypothetical protein
MCFALRETGFGPAGEPYQKPVENQSGAAFRGTERTRRLIMH